MAEPSTRLTAIDQCVANVAGLLLAQFQYEAETLDLVTDILPQASMSHPIFGPVAEAVMAIEVLARRRDLDPVQRGKLSQACYSQLRRVLIQFWHWRLMHALERAMPQAGRAA